MTEYFRMKAYNLTSLVFYDFEVFAIMMLEEIDYIFKYYFIPSHEKFINLFASKKDIYNLLSSLDIYHLVYSEYNNDDNCSIKNAIRKVIESLINIELSMVNDKEELLHYRNKFMDLIGSKNVSDILSLFYPKYYGYADEQLRKKLLYR